MLIKILKTKLFFKVFNHKCIITRHGAMVKMFVSSFQVWSNDTSPWLIATSLQCALGIQVRNSKNDLNMEALSMGCRNKHESQCFNPILISSTGFTTVHLAILVQAALDSRAACTTTTAGQTVVNQLMKSKFD